MIKKLEWDTEFFKKKIGTLIFDEVSEVALVKDLEAARTSNYKYIMCHLKSPQHSTINMLENYKFYLSDVGITWEMGVCDYLSMIEERELGFNNHISEAAVEDIPGLQEMIKPMFPNSRFYSDPFFSHEEADQLHVIWIKNSVLGKAADVVLHIPNKGFVTCKKREDGIGEIILIGVKDGIRGENLGQTLMNASIKWFLKRDIKNVKVKTQLKNVKAMNFYRKLGFSIESFDATYSNIL
jgi:dTDP-4-amino-4,6-dideoxy-D-galactose acyltransferase